MSILRFSDPLDPAERLLDDAPLRRCELLECRAACCAYGVWLDLQEVQDLRAHADLIAPFLEEGRRDPSQWFGWQLEEDAFMPSGQVLPCSTVPKPDPQGGTECIFLRRDYRCALQLAGEAFGRDRWRFKPFYCFLHPLTFDGQARLTLAATDQLLGEPASCLRRASQGKPIQALLAEELAACATREEYCDPSSCMIQCRAVKAGPHRLEDQDAALSRPKLGSESPWGHLFSGPFRGGPCDPAEPAPAKILPGGQRDPRPTRFPAVGARGLGFWFPCPLHRPRLGQRTDPGPSLLA